MSRMNPTWPIALALLTLCGAPAQAAAQGTLSAWAVDPHVKVFEETEPPASPGIARLRAAGNEYEPAQIALRSARPLAGVHIELTPLRHANGQATIGGEDLRWNFVGFIPLVKNTRGSEKVRVRAAPCRVPVAVETNLYETPSDG